MDRDALKDLICSCLATMITLEKVDSVSVPWLKKELEEQRSTEALVYGHEYEPLTESEFQVALDELHNEKRIVREGLDIINIPKSMDMHPEKEAGFFLKELKARIAREDERKMIFGLAKHILSNSRD